MVWNACKKVQKKKGGAGADAETLTKFNANLSNNLYKLWNRLSSGSYFPPQVKQVAIPKKDGSQRILGIPTISDRIAQTVLKDYLEERFEKIFLENSYGYRPNKSAHQAIAKVSSNVRLFAWVIDLDIRKFFDNINHELLLKAVRKHVSEPWAIMYIERWLSAGYLSPAGEEYYKEDGTPQGGVISPLLANLYLHYTIDLWLSKQYKNVEFVRYADDMIIHCHSKQIADNVLKALKERVEICKLELHPVKTKIVYCKNYRRKQDYKEITFDFLGFTFKPRTLRSKQGDKSLYLGFGTELSKSAKKSIATNLRNTRFNRWTTGNLKLIADKLNPRIQGWINYYSKFDKSGLRKIFRLLDERIIKWLQNKYKSIGRSKPRAYNLLRNISKDNNKLFSHWKMGYISF